MKIIADESVEKPIVDSLRADDHEVYYILEENRGIADEKVLKISYLKNSILLTADKDFGEIVFRQKGNNHGIVLIRLSGLSIKQKIHTVRNALTRHHDEVKNHFSVISKTHIRIIKL